MNRTRPVKTKEFKKKYNNNLLSSFFSSLISTSITLPYNIVLLRKTLLKNTEKIEKKLLYKSGGLEYFRTISGSTIFLYTYNFLRTDKYPIYISGIVSSVIVWILTYPIDNIKNQIIANRKIIFDFKSLYKGIQYPIIRSVPSSIVGFYVYEYLRDNLNIK